MLRIRRANDRGHFDHGWLETYHTFSFGEYIDREFMYFRTLRVLNEDWIQPGQGFGTHPHRDMEIITIVVSGALEHKDSLGNGSIIRPGEVQCMSAGTGILHSEFNPSQADIVHLLQIWIVPERNGLTPDYEQKSNDIAAKKGRFCLVASPDSSDGTVTIHQDVSLFLSLISPGETMTFELAENRHAWIQVVRGSLTFNETSLKAGDGAAISAESALNLTGKEESELLLFDLP